MPNISDTIIHVYDTRANCIQWHTYGIGVVSNKCLSITVPPFRTNILEIKTE